MLLLPRGQIGQDENANYRDTLDHVALYFFNDGNIEFLRLIDSKIKEKIYHGAISSVNRFSSIIELLRINKKKKKICTTVHIESMNRNRYSILILLIKINHCR